MEDGLTLYQPKPRRWGRSRGKKAAFRATEGYRVLEMATVTAHAKEAVGGVRARQMVFKLPVDISRQGCALGRQLSFLKNQDPWQRQAAEFGSRQVLSHVSEGFHIVRSCGPQPSGRAVCGGSVVPGVFFWQPQAGAAR